VTTAELARQLLSLHGIVRAQQPRDWTGPFALPTTVERYYWEVGPFDVYIRAYGNPFFVPRLGGLWDFQAGYRWNGITREPSADWNDDWLVVADQGGDPFILSRRSGAVLHDQHGCGVWEPVELFPDLNTMAACLGQLGAVVVSAGKDFTTEDCYVRPEWRAKVTEELCRLLNSSTAAEGVLGALAWDIIK
jgi:hypothetical protein